MARRTAEEYEPSTTSHTRKAQRLTTENDAPSSERKSKNLVMVLYSNVLNLGRVTDQQDIRPSQSNRGQGGAIAQLQAVSDCLHKQRTKKPSNNILLDVNKMAPPEKTRRRTVVSYFILLHFFSLFAPMPGEDYCTSPSC